MRALLPLLLAALLLALPARANEEIVLGLSQAEVSITTNFNGSEILVYGAVKRDQPIPDGPELQVVMTVSGPSEPVIVRRKEKRFGIWVNTEAVEVDRAPSYYAVVTSAPMADVLKRTEDLRHKVTIDRAIRSVGAPDTIDNAASFTDAVIRIRRDEGIYATLPGAVEVDQQTLFDTSIALPANLIEGAYAVRVLLMRDKQVVSEFETAIEVHKVGLERWLYNLAQDHALLYGLLSLVIAVAAGWLASTVFRLLRG